MDSPAFSFQAGYEHPDQNEDDANLKYTAFNMKGPKRKRLAKACDACHKVKRRCDGSAPCSNCYFASKPCHYTDASGRPVAAPHTTTGKPDASKAPRSSSARSRILSEDDRPGPSTSQDGDRRQYRKRMKNDLPSANIQIHRGASSDSGRPHEDDAHNRVAPLVLDHALTRELTNLFFAHCHPLGAIIHKPSFSASLSHNRVPSYLLYAMCALAAPLSRQPRIRTAPPRLSGRPFAREAVSLMFDGPGHLICDPNLQTAQALCLLMAHDLQATKESDPASSRYRGLTLQIVQVLGLHNSEPPASTPVPTADFIHASIERESVRRIFWVTHILSLHSSTYTQRPITLIDSQLRLRLPVDETSFELAVHSTLTEYLYLAPLRTHCVSELGHLIRIMSIYAQAEQILNGSDSNLNTLADLDKRGEEWVASLPEHLEFSEQNLQVQKSMFETGSNTGAWCFCCMHVYYASLALALHVSRNFVLPHLQGMPQRPQWTVTRLGMIMDMLGDRAKNSLIMGASLWAQIKYCHRDDTQIRGWCDDYEELWGTRIPDLVAALTMPWGSYPQGSAHMLPPVTSSPLGRSLDELRLHSHGPSWSGPSPMAVRVKDVIPSRGNVEMDGDSSKGRRRVGESLPSLKASGLLDSWRPVSASNAHSRSTRSPLLGKESDAGSMPAGLKWLAKEPR